MVVRVWPVSTLVAVTVAFGITAPEGSLTVPVKAPVPGVWAISDGTLSKEVKKSRRKTFLNLMTHSSVLVVSADV